MFRLRQFPLPTPRILTRSTLSFSRPVYSDVDFHSGRDRLPKKTGIISKSKANEPCHRNTKPRTDWNFGSLHSRKETFDGNGGVAGEYSKAEEEHKTRAGGSNIQSQDLLLFAFLFWVAVATHSIYTSANAVKPKRATDKAAATSKRNV